MKLFLVALGLFAIVAVAQEVKNEPYDTNGAVGALADQGADTKGLRSAAISEEETLKNRQEPTVRDGLATLAKAATAPAVVRPSNVDGVLSINAVDDLRNPNGVNVDPEAAKAAIDGIFAGQDTQSGDADQQATDEEDEDKDDDDEAKWERMATKAEESLVKSKVVIAKTEIVDNTRKPVWPLSLRASPRLPVTDRELHRNSRPRDLVLAYDGRAVSTERSGVRFPHTKEFNSPDWTISFWIKLGAHSTAGSWKNILNKGHNSKDRSPGLWISNVNRLWTRLFTDHHYDEGFHSVASIPVGVPTHIAIVRRERTFALFINGQLDSHMVTIGRVIDNDGPLHISRSPGYLGFNGELYTFRWYSRGLSIDEIRTNSAIGSSRPLLGLTWNKKFSNDDLDTITVPHTKAFETPNFSVAFWLTLDQDSTGQWRSVFHKGGLTSMTPSCFMMPNFRKLSCHVSTTHTPDEQVVSKSIIPLHTPTHIALVREGRALTLYINGVLDIQAETVGYTAHNSFHLNIGTSRWSHKGVEHSAGIEGRVSVFTWLPEALNIIEVRHNMERESPRPILQLDTRITYQIGDRTVVPHMANMNSQAFTISFWINLKEEAARKSNKLFPDRDWNVIFHKGASDQQNTPSLWFKPSLKASKLQVRMSTTHSFRELFDSAGSIKVNTPTRIALTLQGKVLKLYINDEEDSVFILSGVPVENFGPLFLGSDNFAAGAKGEIEDLRWFDRALSSEELASVSAHHVFRFWTPPLVGGPVVRVENAVDFNGFNMMTFPDSNLRGTTMTVSFWLTLTTAPNGVNRVLFSKGVKGSYQPLVTINHESKVQIRIQTTHDKDNGEGKISAHSIFPGSPYHVAYVIVGRDVKLYINGVLDSYFSCIGDPILNDSPWRVGKSLELAGVVGRISQFRIYTHAVIEADIRSIAEGTSRKPALNFRWNGAFDGTNIVKIPHNTALDAAEMTVSCWLTVTDKASGAFRVIWQKGDSNNQRTPSMALRPNVNKLQASVSTSRLAVEVITSEHVLAVGVPTLVTYVLQNREQRIYINGILDSTAPLQGDVIFNSGPLQIGKSLWGEGFVGKINGLEIFGRALDDQEIMEFAAAIHVPASLAFDVAGKFDGTDMMIVPHSPIFDSPTYSVLFWLTLRADPSNDWVTILHKGGKNSERAPGVFLYPFEHKLYFAISTEKNPNAGLTAATQLVKNVPSHIAMVVNSNTLTVYIDGVNQGTLSLTSPIATNKGPLYIMRDLWYGGCDGVLTGFRILPTALDQASVTQTMAKDERL